VSDWLEAKLTTHVAASNALTSLGVRAKRFIVLLFGG